MEASASPAPPGPDRLFDSHRLPSDGLLLLSLLLYAPVGLCLLLLRLFLGLHVFLVSCALPDCALRRFIVRVMCSVLGLLVRQSHSGQRSLRARVYIANHVTHFDHNIVNLLTSCNAPMLNGASGFICWSRGFLEVGNTGGRAELLETLKAYSSYGDNPPLLLFPEETTTNGRVGLLRFSSWPFSILDVVQPVALQVQRPFIAASTSDASWVTELLWTFFVPFTIYQVRWLPLVFRQAEETREELALRVQELLASELGVVSTRVTAADKIEHLKRLRHSSRALSIPAQTNCVDTTIANLLEGRVPFTPIEAEDESSMLGPSGSSSQPAPSPPAAVLTSKLFARSPEDRHLSLQDRKNALYEYARRRYTDKYGMPENQGSG